MSVTVERRPEGLIVVVEGLLDSRTAERLRGELTRAVEENGVRIVFDLSLLQSDDSTGLGVLIGTVSEVLKPGGDVRLVHSPRLSRIWNITGMSRIVPSYGSQDDAFAA